MKWNKARNISFVGRRKSLTGTQPSDWSIRPLNVENRERIGPCLEMRAVPR